MICADQQQLHSPNAQAGENHIHGRKCIHRQKSEKARQFSPDLRKHRFTFPYILAKHALIAKSMHTLEFPAPLKSKKFVWDT